MSLLVMDQQRRRAEQSSRAPVCVVPLSCSRYWTSSQSTDATVLLERTAPYHTIPTLHVLPCTTEYYNNRPCITIHTTLQNSIVCCSIPMWEWSWSISKSMRHTAKDTSSAMVKNLDPAVLPIEESFSWLRDGWKAVCTHYNDDYTVS